MEREAEAAVFNPSVGSTVYALHGLNKPPASIANDCSTPSGWLVRAEHVFAGDSVDTMQCIMGVEIRTLEPLG